MHVVILLVINPNREPLAVNNLYEGVEISFGL